MNEKLFRDQLQKRIYRLGYLVWGQTKGGAMTTNLLKRVGGLWETMDALISALGSANAQDYMGGVLRKQADKVQSSLEVGHIMGRYCYNGTRMVDGRDCPKGFRIESSEWDGERWHDGKNSKA